MRVAMQRLCKRGRLSVALALLLCGALAGPLHAAPRVPVHDGEALERLPHPATDPVARELRALRAQLSRAPNDLPLAVQLARRYIEHGRRTGDPRYYGYAEAALQPWWHVPEPPAQIRVLRATLAQGRHDFDSALHDLTLALKMDARNAQAWLTRAAILQARADYPQARHSCLALLRLTTPLITTSCLAGIAGLTGESARAYQRLSEAVTASPRAQTGEQVWALTLLAEIAARTRQPAAEQHFQAALRLDPRDNYLLAAYADFLLEQERPAEVRALLKDQARADNLLLRLALAAQALGASELAMHTQTLQARFAASRLRGDNRHLREEARFTLQLLKQPARALQLARQNWTLQREPADARILLEAALAAQDRRAAQPVLDWLTANRVEDAHLQRLRAQFNAPGKPS